MKKHSFLKAIHDHSLPGCQLCIALRTYAKRRERVQALREQEIINALGLRWQQHIRNLAIIFIHENNAQAIYAHLNLPVCHLIRVKTNKELAARFRKQSQVSY